MENEIIKILDFTEYPGPRYISQGFDSGEEFYQKILKKNFEKHVESKDKILVDLDDTAGFAPSFIDEIFGNLVYDFEFSDILKYLEIKSNDEPDWIELINENILPKWNEKKRDGQPRKPRGF